MTSLYILVQARESDETAVGLLKHLIETGDVKRGEPTRELDPKTVMLSFKDVGSDVLTRIVADSKQWADDMGFLFMAYGDTVHSQVSLQNGAIENEDVTIASLLEL